MVPVASEEGLRTRAWIEGNRHLVDSLSHDRLAYVWLPNTGGGGYTSFTRDFFAQQDKVGPSSTSATTRAAWLPTTSSMNSTAR